MKGKREKRNGKRKEGNAVGKSALAAKEVCQACAMTWPSPNSEPAAAAPCQRQVRVEGGMAGVKASLVADLNMFLLFMQIRFLLPR